MHLRGSCSSAGGCLPLNSRPHKDKLETLSLGFNHIASFFQSWNLKIRTIKKESMVAETSSESAEVKRFSSGILNLVESSAELTQGVSSTNRDSLSSALMRNKDQHYNG